MSLNYCIAIFGDAISIWLEATEIYAFLLNALEATVLKLLSKIL